MSPQAATYPSASLRPARHGGRRRLRHERPRARVEEFDAVVVGGGPAGLSAALVLGRARRRVLVLDTGRPANAASNGIGGLLAQTGVVPADLRRAGREQLAGFPNVEVRDGAVLDATSRADGFGVKLEGGQAVQTRALDLGRHDNLWSPLTVSVGGPRA